MADKTIETEQAELARAGSLSAVHWLIVGTSFVVTLLAWYGSQHIVTERAEQRFERESDHIVELVTEGLQRYEDALWAAAAAIEANEGVNTLFGWQNYSDRLDLARRYPYVTALNILQKLDPDELPDFVARERLLRPDFNISAQNEGDVHLVVTYVSPERGNEAAIGYDAARDPARRKAFMRAATLNGAQLTPPLVLVQDSSGTISFVMAVPFYRGWQNPTLLDRNRLLEGFVVMPLRIGSVVEGLVGFDDHPHLLRITDGDVLVHDNHSASLDNTAETADAKTQQTSAIDRGAVDSDGEARGRFTADKLVNVYGRQWNFQIDSSPQFSTDAGYLFPSVVLVGGLFIDLLLLCMFLLLARANRRALSLAQRTAEKLRLKADALVATNQELESFAYVVSHDLKTPLRGIQDLTDYIEEDLQDTFETDDAHREAQRNLGRIGQQVKRSNALIEGILDYSGVGMREEQVTEVNVARLIEDIVDGLPIRAEQVIRRGVLPVFDTYGVRLAQVLANLIGNAFKYHHDASHAQVVVEVVELDRQYRFSVQDDGPGIERRFHDRVFEVFKTLQSRDAIESTGVGLSIVKKSVELLGGRVWIESTPGTGTTMIFEWPKEIHESVQPARKVA